MVASPGFSVPGILQARILELFATSSSRGSSQPRDRTCVTCLGRWVLYHWATWETPILAANNRNGSSQLWVLEAFIKGIQVMAESSSSLTKTASSLCLLSSPLSSLGVGPGVTLEPLLWTTDLVQEALTLVASASPLGTNTLVTRISKCD